jgi:hypothetical protein
MRKHYPEKRILAEIENTYQRKKYQSNEKTLTNGEYQPNKKILIRRRNAC